VGRLLALIAALALGGLIAWRVQTPPRPEPASAPATHYSAERAFSDIAVIARAPHPVGSAEHAVVRDHILARMAQLGLAPRIQQSAAMAVAEGERTRVYGARVENLIGVLPGRDRALPALALMAHYDSVAGSPGAADDAAGVASALEIVRAIKAEGVPARDVAVVITDGEEPGLLGATGFFRDDPLAKHLGFVLNMEARGGGGRALMFETGRDAGADIDLLRKVARQPQALSLTSFLYARMPNDTDFTLARNAGVPGFNYAWLGRAFDYHSPTSTPAALDRHALQDMGDQVLAAASSLAFAAALPPRAPDKVYGQVFGDLLVAYPPLFGWALIALIAVFLGVAIWRARAIAPVPPGEIARGAGAALFAAIGAAAVLHFARLASGAGFGWLEQRVLLAQPVRWEACVLLLAAGFLILSAAELARGRRAAVALPLLAGLGACVFAGMDRAALGLGLAAGVIGLFAYGRPVSRPAGWAGVLLISLVAATAVQIAAPAVAPVFAWPLLAASAAAAATALSARERRPYMLFLALVASLGLGWIGGVGHIIHLALDAPALLAIPVWTAAALVWPLAQPVEGAPPARLAGPLLIAAGLAVLFAVRFDPPWSVRHPQAVAVGYRFDDDHNTAWRTADVRTPWTDAILRAGGGEITPDPDSARPRYIAPAPMLDHPHVLVRQEAGGVLTFSAPARELRIELKPEGPATLAEVSGGPVAVTLKPDAWTVVTWSAPALEGLSLRLTGPAGGPPPPVAVRYAARIDDLPGTAAPPMPARMMGFEESGTSRVVGTYRAAW
jgi:hypothetical protein